MRHGSATAPANPWNVMRELATMQERMSRILAAPYAREQYGTNQEDSTHHGAWAPLVDIYENAAREVVIKADVPGLKREDIDLTFDNNVLTVRGERRPDDTIKDEAYHRVERAYGLFSRSFTLPATIDAARVRAEYRDGVLTVTLPMREETRPRQIQVEGGE
jgi:HSP20 family protein